MSTIHEAFEAKYQRSAEDPSSAEMLAVFTDGFNAATERAAKQERELRAALFDLIKPDFAYVGADADTGNPDSLYCRVRRARALLEIT